MLRNMGHILYPFFLLLLYQLHNVLLDGNEHNLDKFLALEFFPVVDFSTVAG